MFTHEQKEKLKANWGEKADSLQCKAEVRLYDDLSSWECYIFAMNPEDEDEIEMILKGFTVEICKGSMFVLLNMFNEHGEPLKKDFEYLPRMADQIYRKLKEL